MSVQIHQLQQLYRSGGGVGNGLAVHVVAQVAARAQSLSFSLDFAVNLTLLPQNSLDLKIYH